MAKVAEVSVVKKINRVLRPMGEVLRDAYNHEHSNHLGNYYTSEATTGKWIQTNLDLRILAIQLDVIDEEDEIVEE